MELNDIIELISKRDRISYEEAATWVQICQDEIADILENNPTYDAITDCIASTLGLEPDYMDVLMSL